MIQVLSDTQGQEIHGPPAETQAGPAGTPPAMEEAIETRTHTGGSQKQAYGTHGPTLHTHTYHHHPDPLKVPGSQHILEDMAFRPPAVVP